jgi:hypothetical protein
MEPLVNKLIRQLNQAKQQLSPPNHSCPPCPLIHLPTLHVCPTCSHSDYEQLKEQLVQQKTNCKLEKEELESTMLNKIITELGLETPQTAENAFQLVITELKAKLKPDGSDKQTIISELEKQLATAQATRHKPTAEVVKKVSEKLKNDEEALTKLQNSSTYSELLDIYQENMETKVANEVSKKKQVKQLNIALSVLSVSSLLMLAAILIK